MNTSSLGGLDGTLQALYSNGTAALATNPTTAAAIVNEAANQVSSLQGQLAVASRVPPWIRTSTR